MLTVKAVAPAGEGVDRRTHRLVTAWLATHQSDNTRDAYRGDLAAFTRWCDDNGTEPLRASPHDLARYRDACLAAGANPSTVTRRLSGLASFFRYAKRAGTIEDNPAAFVERPGRRSAGPATLDEGEVESLLDAADLLGPKTAALISLLALDGLKLGEALAVDVPSIRPHGGTVPTVEVRRGGQRHQLELVQRTAAAVSEYVAERTRGPLFLGDRLSTAKPPARLSRFGADFLVKRAGAAAGIEKRVSANVLRRSYVEAAPRAGTPLTAIARHVGHKEVRETARLLEGGR